MIVNGQFEFLLKINQAYGLVIMEVGAKGWQWFCRGWVGRDSPKLF